MSQRDVSIAECAAAANPRLLDQVITAHTAAEQNVAIVFDAFQPVFTTADARGLLHVYNYSQQSQVNSFRSADEPVALQSLFLLNEIYKYVYW